MSSARSRILLVTAVLLLLSGILFWTQHSSVHQPIHITYWTPEPESYVKASEELVRAFNASQDRIVVEHRFFPFETRYSRMVRRAFEGTPDADVIMMYGGTQFLAQCGKIQPVPETLVSMAQLETRYQKTALQNRVYEGRCWGLPLEINLESPSLFVNRKILRERGIELPAGWKENNGPATWSELQAFARQFVRFEEGKMTAAGLGIVNRQEESMFLSLIWQLGGDYRDYDGQRIRFSTPEARQALAFMTKLVAGPESLHSYALSEPMDMFSQGQLAMTIGAPWYAPEFDPSTEYLCLNLPPFMEGAKPYFVCEGGWGVVVTATTPHPEAAWEFVDFLTREENLLFWAKAVASMPPVKPADPERLRKALDERSMVPVLSVLEYGTDPGFLGIDTYALVWQVVRRNLRACLHGELPMEQALANMDREANELLQKSNASSPQPSR